MKKTGIILIIVAALNFGGVISAQSVSMRVNISSQPLWGPVGYDYVEYYYLPACDVFYSVPQHQFIYLSNGQWLYATALPGMYVCDPYTTYKVVVNKSRPWTNHTYYVTHYVQYKTVSSPQVVIRNSDDPKYYVVKGHPKYNGKEAEGKKPAVKNSSKGLPKQKKEKVKNKVKNNDQGEPGNP